MKPYRSLLILATIPVLLLAGCIYTHTVEPLTLDMHRTPVVSTQKEGSLKVISLPLSYRLIAWDSAAIGDIAKQHGFKEVYYADLETLSVFFHVWNQYTVHVYGQ
jgi:hypothetical protein